MEIQFFTICLVVLGIFAILLSLLQTSSWRRRSGIQVLDFSSLIKFMLALCANLGNVIFVLLLMYSLIIMMFYKLQNKTTEYDLTSEQELLFVVFSSVAVILKTIQVLTLIMGQCSIDIFFVDWERRKANEKISIWRTFFIANEWHEIETTRKTNPVLQLFIVVLVLKVMGYEDMALKNQRDEEMPVTEYSPVLRFAIGSLVYLATGVFQAMYFVVIHERFFEDPIRQFVDLCSVANVSVFILNHKQFGFYIHGRSVHGTADTDMVGMTKMLQREQDGVVSRRGLIEHSDIQSFDIQIPRKMRMQFDKIYEPLKLLKNHPAARGHDLGEKKSAERAKAYIIMRNFLTSFFEHALRDLDYIVKDKLFLEKLLGMEFRDPIDKAHLNSDETGCSFCEVLFYGHEAAFLIFQILVFSITDLMVQDFVLSTIVSYIVYEALVQIRQLLSSYNITRKTLVDGRFLI